MLYSTCPTCGYFLGQKILEWESKSKEICDNPKYSKEEKEKLKEKLIQKKITNAIQKKLKNSVNLFKK